MADPSKYVPGYSFTNFQTANPSLSLPAPQVDNELAKISGSLNDTIDGLEDIRRSDGKLQNGIVTKDSLATDVALGFGTPTVWATNTVYKTHDAVFTANKFYICITAHTSGVTFDPTMWTMMADMTIGVSDTGAWFSGVDTVQTTDYTVLVGDAGKMLIGNSATPITFTWFDTSGLGTSLFLVRNIGVGTLTLCAATGQSIEGIANPSGIVLTTGRFAIVWVSGSGLRAQVVAAVSDIVIPGTGNRVINGAHLIAQRGVGPTTCPINVATLVTDRWKLVPTGVAVTAQRVQDFTSGHEWTLRLTGAAGNTGVTIRQRIESFNLRSLPGGQVALTATWAAPAGKVVTWNLYYPSVENNFATRVLIATGTFVTGTGSANWMQNTIFPTLPTNAQLGLEIEFTVPSLLAGETLSFTGVQLDKTLVDYQHVNAATEMVRCMRYYQQGTLGAAQEASTHLMFLFGPLPVIMRAAPTLTFKDQLGNVSRVSTNLAHNNGFTGGALTFNNVGYQCNFTVVSGIYVIFNYYLDAEL